MGYLSAIIGAVVVTVLLPAAATEAYRRTRRRFGAPEREAGEDKL